MRIEIKWLPDTRKRPVPAQYACTVSFTNPPVELYSVMLHFPQQVRTWAELELLVVRDLVLPDDVFYITEGGTVVAEAWVREPKPVLVRNVRKNGVLGWQVVEDGEWVDVLNRPTGLCVFHKTEVIND